VAAEVHAIPYGVGCSSCHRLEEERRELARRVAALETENARLRTELAGKDDVISCYAEGWHEAVSEVMSWRESFERWMGRRPKGGSRAGGL
jgi:hypothetical protein